MTRLGRVMPDLGIRDLQAEVMDDPGLEPDRHLDALRALGRVNRVSLAGRRLWHEVAALHSRLGRPVRILDLACGGADLLADLATRAHRAGTPVELHGCDVSPVAVEHGRRTAPAGAPIEVFQLDALTGELPGGYDLLTSSLFLHHLDDAQAVSLLRRMSEAAREALFVQDLCRTRLGYLFAWIGLHTMTRSDVARVDGLRSVRAAFTVDEARSLCSEAGLTGAAVRRCWPQRFTIRWVRGRREGRDGRGLASMGARGGA